jgi:hypothetical protein
MSRIMAPVAAVAALLGSLVPLLLLDGPARAWGFRVYVLAVGFLAARAVVRRVDAAAEQTADELMARPFHRARPLAAVAWGLWSRVTGRRRAMPLEGGALLVNSATLTAGGTHHRLRPVLCAIADERLRARHGISLDDPRAAASFRPASWEILRPDRPAPDDRLGPGLTFDAITAVLDDLEAC